MKNELLRRLSILENKQVPQVTARILRGGMQERLHRQEAIRFRNDVRQGKKKIKDKLASIVEKEISETMNASTLFSSQSAESLDEFREPIMKRIRSRRGFF